MEQHCSGEDRHVMAKGAKHCGECGAQASVETKACAACENTMAKSMKFCPECGVEAKASAADIGAALTELELFRKSSVTIESDLLSMPKIPIADVDVAPIESMLKSSVVKDDETGASNLDAIPVVTQLMQAIEHGRRQQGSDVDAMAKGIVHILRGQVTMAKAIGAIGQRLSEYELAENQPSGRKGARVLALARPEVAGAPAGDGRPRGGAGNGLMGSALLAKAFVGRDNLMAKGAKNPLSPTEETALTDWLVHEPGAAERTIEELAQHDAGLAMKTTELLAAAAG